MPFVETHFQIMSTDDMGRLLQTDHRYKMLAKIPRVHDGQVVFRKKPGRAKYVIVILELDGFIHSVLYRMSTVVHDGVPTLMMTFHDFRRT